MNWLVYKNSQHSQVEEDLSVVLKQKLSILQEELDTIGTEHYIKNQNADNTNETTKLPYKEWLKHKDAESRLKRKLIVQAQDELRQHLLKLAENEQKQGEERIK